MKKMVRLTQEQKEEFKKAAFPGERLTDSYSQEWNERLSSPKNAWSASDYDRREVLKEKFPKTFGKLNKDTNLNNREFTESFNTW